MKKITFLSTFLLIFASLIPTIVYADISNDFGKNLYKDKETFITRLQKEKPFDLSKTMISYDPNPKPIVIEKGKENYINPITKEYFIIRSFVTKSGRSYKYFEFDISSSVESAAFKVGSSTLSIDSKADLLTNSGQPVSPIFGSTYGIELKQGWFKSKDASFRINSSETKSFGSGWSSDKDTYVRIYNDGSFDRYSGQHLVGSGSVD